MSLKFNLRIAKLSLILATIPFLVRAYEFGPPFGYSSAPGDSNCTACHSSFPVNSQGGNVKILLPAGNTGTYVPGQAIQLMIQITDSRERAYGFELSARLASNPSSGQAGNLSPADRNTQLVCGDGSNPAAPPCPSQFPIQEIQHNFTGYLSSINSTGAYTYTVNWTPPANASAGNVTLYVAANCGPGQPAVEFPTHVYTSSLTLTPTAGSPAPSITNVLNAATFQSTLAPNTYAAVFGSNLSTTNPGRGWAASDFTTNSDGTLNMPTTLDGTSVTVGGAAAFINFISPGQLNIITPPGVTGTNLPVVVSLNGQQSAIFSVTIQNLAPSFFAWQPSTSDFGKYLIAQHGSNSTNVGKAGLFPGAPANFTTPAAPGETVVLYGTGFGPTSPQIKNGIETDKVYQLSPVPQATFGSSPASVVFGGLIPPLSQVFQFNVSIPLNAPNGDSPLVVTVGGVPSFSGLITVQGP
jgi:uncharacterized protein (TIGR03437 family)